MSKLSWGASRIGRLLVCRAVRTPTWQLLSRENMYILPHHPWFGGFPGIHPFALLEAPFCGVDVVPLALCLRLKPVFSINDESTIPTWKQALPQNVRRTGLSV